MFVRLVYESFRRQKRRKLLAGVAVTLGVCVATAMIAVATDIGEKINRELRAIGANLVVTPQADTLDVELAGHGHAISGILSTGGAEDDQIVAPLSLAQEIIGRPGAVRRIYVSALTKPEDAFARRDPASLRGPEYDRWYCSPYPQSIAYQLQEAIPHSHAEQIRQVAQNEGTVLSRIKGLMLLITVAALLASALAVSAAMATAIFERRREIGLMKALGAGDFPVSALFFAEATLLALISGLVGFLGGALLARQIGRSIFASQITIEPVLLPLILAIAIVVTFAGSALAIRRAVKFDPVYALRGEA